MEAAVRNLCSRINTFEENVSYENVEATLSPVLEEYVIDNETFLDLGKIRDRVTPLLLSCDKGQVETCRWLLHQLKGKPHCENVLGSILKDRAPESGNLAIHQAALSGKVEIFNLLLEASSKADEDNTAQLLLLLNALNKHQDTPIMMAVVENNIDYLFRHWFSLLTSPSQASEVLIKCNASNDSAISLACGHGHKEVLDVLLQACGGSRHAVTDHDYVRAQDSLLRTKKLHQKLLRKKHDNSIQESTISEILRKCNAIHSCARAVKVALEEKAQVAAEQLLECELTGEETNSSTTPCHMVKASKKKKKKKTDKPKINQQVSTCSNKNHSEKSSDLTFVKLSNGKTAVSVQGRHLDMDDEEQRKRVISFTATNRDSTQKSVDELFRDQLKATQEKTTTDQRGHGYETGNIPDILDALCLDASQLLLPAQGMALHLSPSQLDVIDGVLERQREAVRQARDIQQRLRETAKL